MSNDIGKFIEFVVDLVRENNIFYNTDIEAHYYFLNGGCFDLYKIVHHYFKNCRCMIRKDLNHCAIEYQGKLYDVNGIIEDPQNFFLARKEDFEYMERNFGLQIEELNPEQIKNEIDECRIEGILY